MKKLLPIALILVLLVGLGACVTGTTDSKPAYPSACVPKADGTYDSLIITKLPDVKSVDIMLQLANLEALKHTDVWTKAQAEVLITWMENQLALPDITYATLLAQVIPLVADLNDAAGAEIYLISQYLNILNQPIPISECDKALIKAHLAKQRQIILLATGLNSTKGQPVTMNLKRPKK